MPDTPNQPAPAYLLASIIDSSDDAIVSKDLNGAITSWNKGAERIFGYTRDEVMGRSILLLVPETRLQEEEQFLAKIQAGERIEHYETQRLAKDGRVIDVSVTCSPVRNHTGDIVGASKIIRDITMLRRHAQADLLLAAIVSSSDDAIVSKDLNGIITSWNRGAERIFGYAADEIIGKPVITLIPLDRRDEEPRILARLRSGERVDHFETIRVRKNGQHFPVSLTISPVRNPHGEIVGASKIARDISEWKRMETEREKIAGEREQLLESERVARRQAETANRMKDEFLSTVSHELRTPLNAIVGWTEVLAQGGTNAEEVMEGVEVIKRNALVQAQIIEDLLDLGRIVSGKMQLNVEPVDLGAIIHDALTSVRHAATTKEISIKPVIQDMRGTLMGDSKRLQQVVWNLLTNAIKFTPRGGKIWVTAVRINSHIDISVADNGAGIAADFLPRLFERFSQEDSSTTRRSGGLGIGLALVKQLVELHAGTVRAESAGPGKGSKFTITLPIVAAHQRDADLQQRAKDSDFPWPAADLAGIRVLAVDDDLDSLSVLKRILSGRNAEVRTANSVATALQEFADFLPHVVLSDIGMPDEDGFTLIRKLREHPQGARVPAAALTALARPSDRTKAIHAGFQTHIAKPVAAGEIVAVVHSLATLSQNRTPRPS